MSNMTMTKRPFSSTAAFRTTLESASYQIGAGVGKEKNTRPPISSNAVAYWLIGSAGFVFGIVVIGGLTRLTESGLSITEWKPITGVVPPLSHDDWLVEFDKYKRSPEFKLLNPNITLDEFKFIFFMEWLHRLWGRAIGLTFVIPAAYFVYARKTSTHTNMRLATIAGMIGLQGIIGWWMVKSGLDSQLLDAPNASPRVSQYRLAVHLSAAFILYASMISTGFGVLREKQWDRNPSEAVKHLAKLDSGVFRRLRICTHSLKGLIFLTAVSGAFVAGLDAGMIYNSFPFMGENVVPPSSELFDSRYASNPHSLFNIWYKNMLENPVTVQLTHRILGVTTFTAIMANHLYTQRFNQHMTKTMRTTRNAVTGLVLAQVSLGIATLIYVVPVPLAAMHQAGSLALLTAIMMLSTQIRRPRQAMRTYLAALAKLKV